jgi:ribosomal protein S8E
MAKPNYSFEKRRKELEKKNKKEEKKRRKLEAGKEPENPAAGDSDSASAS